MRSLSGAINFICASRFARPNNILLRHCRAPLALVTANEPSVDHLNTLKAYFKTLNKLEEYHAHPQYSDLVLSELSYLNKYSDAYVALAVQYVEAGGKLTAQGLANLYACADKLGVNSKWLEIYAQPELPHLLRFMNVQNLQDVKSGLTRNKASADLLGLVNKELSSRSQEPFEYARRVAFEHNKFQEAKEPHGANSLLSAIESKKNVYWYRLNVARRRQLNLLSSLLTKKQQVYALDA